MKRSFFLVALLAATIAGAGTAARPPLTIGVTISQTGSAAGTAAYVLQGYQRWVGDANHHGGLLARSVRLKVYDDRSDPATAAALYRKLIVEDKVDLLAGPYASAVSQAVIPVVEEQHKVLIGQTAGTSLFTGEYAVQGNPQGSTYLPAVADVAKGAGYSTVALLANDARPARSRSAPAYGPARRRSAFRSCSTGAIRGRQQLSVTRPPLRLELRRRKRDHRQPDHRRRVRNHP